jgi:hypothetical protein
MTKSIRKNDTGLKVRIGLHAFIGVGASDKPASTFVRARLCIAAFETARAHFNSTNISNDDLWGAAFAGSLSDITTGTILSPRNALKSRRPEHS